MSRLLLSGLPAGGARLVAKPLDDSVHGELDGSRGFAALVTEGDLSGRPGGEERVRGLL